MKKYIQSLCLLILSVAPVNATFSPEYSLRSYLEYIGEDSVTTSGILRSPEADDPMKTLESYMMFGMRLEYNDEEQQFEWKYGWQDSIFMCKNAEFLTQTILRDTAMSLIEPCLLEAYVIYSSTYYKYGESILLEGAEKIIANFHARDIFIPHQYYWNHKEVNNWQEKLRFYDMVRVILTPVKYVFHFDKKEKSKYDRILNESNENSPCYASFRSRLDSMSNLERARITKEQESELIKILLQGIANNEKKSQLTYAFMLLTGQFVDKDEKLGCEILSRLLE